MGITLVKLPDEEKIRPLPFYLTMEEWIARKAPEGDYFFMWQVNPTVIFGRNQQIDTEVNITYCREHGIEFYRRKSGGGCVFADMDNIMFSYITPADEVQTTFHAYAARVAEMLCGLGLKAEAGGRNDVMIGGRKVSGNAFYHIPGRSIVHGTMLYSTNMHHMLNAITPSRSKLESKKVKSVASHITTISEHLPTLKIEDFKRYAADFMADDEWVLSEKDIREIEEMSKPYFTERWIEGKWKGEPVDAAKRIEGAGEFTVILCLDDEGRIDDVNLQGDFFLLQDADEMLFEILRGIRPDEDSIRTAISGKKVEEIISGLSNDAFVNLISEAAGRIRENPGD
ncbi:MAG: lipoyltransferase [Muribaculaceae bacterium]|nr:lipoyltransferase [Muribaculaceae bacterium]